MSKPIFDGEYRPLTGTQKKGAEAVLKELFTRYPQCEAEVLGLIVKLESVVVYSPNKSPMGDFDEEDLANRNGFKHFAFSYIDSDMDANLIKALGLDPSEVKPGMKALLRQPPTT